MNFYLFLHVIYLTHCWQVLFPFLSKQFIVQIVIFMIFLIFFFFLLLAGISWWGWRTQLMEIVIPLHHLSCHIHYMLFIVYPQQILRTWYNYLSPTAVFLISIRIQWLLLYISCFMCMLSKFNAVKYYYQAILRVRITIVVVIGDLCSPSN